MLQYSYSCPKTLCLFSFPSKNYLSTLFENIVF